MTKKTKPRRMTLVQLAAEIDSIARNAYEYRQSEECGEAEYAETFGYGDGDIDLDRLDDETRELVDLMREVDKVGFRENLASICDLTLEGMHCVSNEVFSACLGEFEEQLPDDIGARVKAMTKARQEKLRKLITEACLGYTCPDCIYLGMDNDRWVMSVNTDRLTEWVDGKGAQTATQRRKSIRCVVDNEFCLRDPGKPGASLELIVGGAA